MTLSRVQSEFIQRHALPKDYSRIAQQWFIPVIARILECRARSDGAVIIGIDGSQGSGKTEEKVHFLFELDRHREIEKFSMPVELAC
jgi:pantothenate kinase-related protein Tda10